MIDRVPDDLELLPLEARQSARIAELEAEVESLGDDCATFVLEVERLSRRPDLSPEQCAEIAKAAEYEWIAGGYRSLKDHERAMIAALRAAAEQEEAAPRCTCGSNVEGDWHSSFCPLSQQEETSAWAPPGSSTR